MTAEPHSVPVQPVQQEMHFAVVQGAPMLTLPVGLYIPPDALEVFLDAFEGPLDLLLYLIKRQNLDILDIPIADITTQYMEYVDLMREIRLDLAAEYLVMAAMLAEIKSRMLLPRPSADGEDEEDPRAELIRRLQEYERYKKAAQDLDGLPRLERDHFSIHAEVPAGHTRKAPPDVDLNEVLLALRGSWPERICLPATGSRRSPCPCGSGCLWYWSGCRTGGSCVFLIYSVSRKGAPGLSLPFWPYWS